MKLKSIIAASVTVLAFGAFLVPAQANAENARSKQTLMLASNQTHHGVGTVTTIDSKAKRVELKHGPIKSIGWMGMKMFFDVDDTDLLDEIEVGDKVDFDFIETRDKRYVITDIEAQ
ncbi:MAG TPA: copper-binding protein [Gammaproteobacteria bacterium]|nr:copper-binding protein [Gammaproteobacteria bacterium]